MEWQDGVGCVGVPVTAGEAEGAEWVMGRGFDEVASVKTDATPQKAENFAAEGCCEVGRAL